jgi:hypothetical protein
MSMRPSMPLSLALRSISGSLAVVAQASSAGNLSALNGSFRRTLRAEDKSERTVKSYTEAVQLFADFLAERGHPLTVEAITRDDVRGLRRRPAGALEAAHGAEPLPGPPGVLQVGDWRGRAGRQPDGRHEPAADPRRTTAGAER